MFKNRKIALITAILSGIIGSTATANNVADFYKGKTITIAIPYGPGGTYDKYGSTFANHLGNHIPGKPNVIVQHRPGAGGAKAMNYTYNAYCMGRMLLDKSVAYINDNNANDYVKTKRIYYIVCY